MYILKESIRYNDISYKLGEKVDFTEEDLKIVAPYVELIKGETSKEIVKEVIPNKEKPEVKTTKKTKNK